VNTPIRIGHIDLSFHAASAAVVRAILEDAGHAVEERAAPHEAMFQLYGAGEVDLLVSAWLPASHQRYLAPFEAQTRKLGVLYTPYCIWGVPDYVPSEAVNAVTDLLKPGVLSRMRRTIQGINPGAGISRFSTAMIDAYGLREAGYAFRPGTEAECFDGFEDAVARGEWLVVPLWHPQYLHHRHAIRALHEPKGLLGGQDDATLIIRGDAQHRVHPVALQRLAELRLGNGVVTLLDHRIRKEGLTPLEAARSWLATSGR
jgi:glycine betaine/proline transport system substrate-binding protein